MPVDVASSKRDGSRTVVALVRKAIRTWRKLGGKAIFADTATNAAFVAALGALEVLIIAFEALDDYPYEIDQTDGIQ